MKTDYSKVTFPFEAQFADGGRVRLFGIVADRVIGAAYWTNRDGSEYSVLASDWSFDGVHGSGGTAGMDLAGPYVPPSELAA